MTPVRDMECLGRRLKAIRTDQKLTLRDVRDQCGLAISALSNIERGRRNPKIRTLVVLSSVYGISLATLLEEVEAGRCGQRPRRTSGGRDG